jgi:hypothetical protein
MFDVPKPGSSLAIEQGCTCPVLDNGHGWGAWAEGLFWYSSDCPVHPSGMTDHSAHLNGGRLDVSQLLEGQHPADVGADVDIQQHEGV